MNNSRFCCWVILFLVLHTNNCKETKNSKSENTNNFSTPDHDKKMKNCENEHNTSTTNSKQPKNCSEIINQATQNQHRNHPNTQVSDTQRCIHDTKKSFNARFKEFMRAVESLEDLLEDTDVNETTAITSDFLVALLHKDKSDSTRLSIYANENKSAIDTVSNSKVRVDLPGELKAGPNNTIVFCMITLPTNQLSENSLGQLYENTVVGVSVSGKNVSGLQERVNITINITAAINETQELRCVYLNYSIEDYSSDGCETNWIRGQSQVTCSCNHLTYFGVLMVDSVLTPENQRILSYITLIGCSLSLCGLIVTLLLYVAYRKIRADVSMKVHMNLVIALILLNAHFLPSQMVDPSSTSTSLCIYVALALHYFLLATFSWMALEGVHLYILLVKVFNIYIRKYLLKLSVVGWGVPAVIVSLVVIIDRTAYGGTPLDSSNPNGTKICYITNTTVKMVSTMGVFGLVFIFNVVMLGVTIRKVISLRPHQEFGQSNRDRAKRDIFTLLGVTTLLGITWGVVFFALTTPGQYIFCILNSLQGFFIFLWFVMSLRKVRKSASEMSNQTSTVTVSKSRK